MQHDQTAHTGSTHMQHSQVALDCGQGVGTLVPGRSIVPSADIRNHQRNLRTTAQTLCRLTRRVLGAFWSTAPAATPWAARRWANNLFREVNWAPHSEQAFCADEVEGGALAGLGWAVASS